MTETFLPFDLENLFSSAFILSLISPILPDALPDNTYRDMSFTLLDDMIARGNRVAQFRKTEIELLEELVAPLYRPSTPVPRQDTCPPDDGIHLVTPRSEVQPSELPIHSTEDLTDQSTALADPSVSGVPLAHEPELLFDWREFGMSLNQMLSATDELNANEVGGVERGDVPADVWLWSDA